MVFGLFFRRFFASILIERALPTIGSVSGAEAWLFAIIRVFTVSYDKSERTPRGISFAQLSAFEGIVRRVPPHPMTGVSAGLSVQSPWIRGRTPPADRGGGGASVPGCREHRRAGDVPRGGRRRALGAAARRESWPPKSRTTRLPQRSGSRRGDVLLAIDDRPVQDVEDVVEALHAAQAGATARYTVLRLGAREIVGPPAWRRSRTARGSFYFLLAGDRYLHAADRRRRAAASPARSGHAAFLLAVGGVLRRCSRSRSAGGSIVSTGCSTGAMRSRSCCCRRCSCTLRWCSRSARAALDVGRVGRVVDSR